MSRSTPRIGLLGAVLVLIAALVAGVLAAFATTSGDGSGQAVASSGSGVTGSTASGSEESEAPTRVTIPSIGVDSSLLRLGLNSDRTVQVPPPEKGMTAGWYSGGAAPGEKGATVVIGHNNTRYGKAVFHDLGKVRKGADIGVRDAAGKTVHYTVTGTQTVNKNTFPTEKVYGPDPDAVLRLVTCDGSLDAAGHPVDNLIVYASLR